MCSYKGKPPPVKQQGVGPAAPPRPPPNNREQPANEQDELSLLSHTERKAKSRVYGLLFTILRMAAAN